MHIDFILIDDQSDMSGFDVGHIEINLNKKHILSSKDFEQNMMIYLSVVDLLDGFSKFFQDEKVRTYEFVGSGSSFTMQFIKKNNEMIEVSANNIFIGKFTSNELLYSLERDSNLFIQNSFEKLPDGDPVKEDLHEAWANFYALSRRRAIS